MAELASSDLSESRWPVRAIPSLLHQSYLCLFVTFTHAPIRPPVASMDHSSKQYNPDDQAIPIY
jgi:hypothetical protein